MQEKSLDLSMVHFDPDKPSIWFPAKDDSSRDEVTIAQSPDSETQHGSVSIVRETTDERVSDGPLEPTSSSPLASDTHSKDQSVLLQRQITLQYPVIVTPSQHIQELAGPLSSEALKGIYDGRHSPVPTDELRVLSYFLRYAYAVYSLDPSIEESFSLFSYACTRPEPETVILNSFTELGLLSQQENTEIIHLNCSNRVLSHLPYLIALDHSEKAVVIAIRGTISVADLVTDVVVYPEVIDDWIPESIKVKSSTEGPAFAHAGMFSAAKAIYRDMEQRGILKSTGTTVSRNESSHGNVRERSDKKIGELIFSKVKEGWNVMVVGHSLGAGAAALLSLKLCQFFPRMHCIAYSCPGALVSKNVAHAMKDICTTVVSRRQFLSCFKFKIVSFLYFSLPAVLFVHCACFFYCHVAHAEKPHFIDDRLLGRTRYHVQP